MKDVIMLETVETTTNGDPEDKNGKGPTEKGYEVKCWYKLRKGSRQTLPNQLVQRLKGLGHVDVV